MKKYFLYCLSLVIVSLPLFSYAQTTDSIQSLILDIIRFINSILIPLLFGIALLAFIINVVRYFIIGSTSEEGRTKAKQTAIYSILAFVFLVSIWSIVNLFVNGLNFWRNSTPCPDYNPNCNEGPLPSPTGERYVDPDPSQRYERHSDDSGGMGGF